MKFERLEIQDLVLIEPTVIEDKRGFFSESFRLDKLEEFIGYKLQFCQENESKSKYGVLRGLHYQLNPFAQTKLVRVIEGSVLDVAVDIRVGSPTFGKHISIELNSKNKKQLLIPRGFAHGFIVLSKEAVFSYKVDNYYNPKYDRGISFSDPSLNVDWSILSKNIKLSEKDLTRPLLCDAELFNFNTKLYD